MLILDRIILFQIVAEIYDKQFLLLDLIYINNVSVIFFFLKLKISNYNPFGINISMQQDIC